MNKDSGEAVCRQIHKRCRGVRSLGDLLGERVRQKLKMAHQLGPALRRLSQYHDHRFGEAVGSR